MSAQDLSDYKSLFLTTAKEHIDAIDYQLGLLNSSADSKEVTDEIFRRAHSLKGSSAMMGFGEVTSLCIKIIDIIHSDPPPSITPALIHSVQELNAQLKQKVYSL